MENQKIIQTITGIFNGTDAHDWSKVQRSMAGNVLLDYTSISGGSPALFSPQQITSAWAELLPGFQSTHHQIGNFTIAVTGQQATANFRGIALHYLPNKTHNDYWAVVGSYEYHLIRDDRGEWKADQIKFTVQKQQGNLDLPQLAQENVKQKVVFKTQPVSAETSKVISAFFEALEARDISAFMQVWAPGGKQLMPLAPQGFPALLDGSNAVYNQYKTLPENYTSMKFPYRVYPTENPHKAIVQYSGLIALKKGGEYNNNYVGVFETKDGKLTTFTEYFDPFILEEAFGGNLQSNFNVTAQPANVRNVTFMSEGLILQGKLHVPADFAPDKTYKAIVVTGSWTTVKEQMPDLYAAKMARQGYVTLTFDFRNYGASEGEPRNLESPEMKAQDIINAVKYLQTVPFIDKDNIGGLAICASSGYMTLALVKGAGLKAVNFVAPWLHNAALVKEIYGGDAGVADKIKKAEAAKAAFAKTGKTTYVPAVSKTDQEAAMFGDFEYYLNPERGAVKQWPNQFAVMAWKGWLEFDPIQYSSKIKVPVQIIHSQTAAVPKGASKFYEALNVTKNIIWVDKATQFDFYDQEPYTTNAVLEVDKWFDKHLH